MLRLIAARFGIKAPQAPEELNFEDVASDLLAYGDKVLWETQDEEVDMTERALAMMQGFEGVGLEMDVVM